VVGARVSDRSGFSRRYRNQLVKELKQRKGGFWELMVEIEQVGIEGRGIGENARLLCCMGMLLMLTTGNRAGTCGLSPHVRS
jgi:hypothetical protein